MEIELIVEEAGISKDVPELSMEGGVHDTSPLSPRSPSIDNSSEDLYGNDQQGGRANSSEQPMRSEHEDNADDSLDTTNDDPPGDDGDDVRLFLEVSFGDLSLDTLLMYFESKRRSGGGPIAGHKLVKPGVVHIAFEQQKIAERVSTRIHAWEKQHLGVILLEERGPEPDTIEVSGFSSLISADVLELYFENPRKSGGDEISKSGMNEDQTKFTMKFSNPKVVEKVLRKKHELSNCKLMVKRPGKEIFRRQGKRLSRIVSDFENEPLASLKSDDDASVLVTFDEEILDREMLLMYFESEKYSSGGDISKSHLHQPGSLIIKFNKIGVANQVCSRSHKCQGQHVDVSLIEELDPAPNTIEVSGFPPMIGAETLEMYFENKRSGGGNLVSSKLSEDESKFIATFENDQIVERVLARDHKINRCPLVVKRPNKEWKFKDSVDKSVLEVHGADENIDTDILQMYFESKKSGGNGEDVNAEYDVDRNVWTVRFSSSEVAASVLNKSSHKLGKRDIKVQRPQLKKKIFSNKPNAKKVKQQEDEDTVPLVVEKVDSSISDDHMRLYFESKKKSCGGPIALMQKNQKVTGSWIIHFQQNGVAEAVVQQKHHELSGTRLTVRLGMKQVKRPLNKNCLLITDLPKQLNEEMFDLYLEKVTLMSEPTVKFGKDPTKAMVTYADPINDIDEVISNIKEEKLCDVTINAKKVFDVDTVIVKNLKKSCKKEMLKLYFENPSRSGGGPIQEMYLDKERGEGTLQFANYKVVQSVCKRKHKLDNKDLEICLCHDEIGEFVSDGSQWIPDPVSVKVDPYLLTFACKNQEFMNKLSAAGIQIKFDKDSPDVVKLHVDSAFDLKNIHDWNKYATSTFKRLCDQFDIKWLDIGDECFEDFQPYVEKAAAEDVELQLDDSSPSLIIVGVRHVVDNTFQQLAQQLKIMNDEIKRKKDIVVKSEKCKALKIKKIHLLNFEETSKSKFGVDFVVDDNSSTITFTGLPSDIDSASLCLYKDLENIVEVSFLCESAEISNFLKKFYDDVIRVQKDNHLHIEYVVEENRVKVYSTSIEDAKATRSSIEKIIKSKTYPLPSDKVKVLKSAEGKELLAYFKALELLTIGDVSQAKGETCIIITGFDTVVGQVVDKLNEFLLTNQIVEKKKPTERGVVLLLEKHHSHEISSIENALEASFVKLIPKADLGCVLIRGNRSGIDKATEKIIVFESKVQIGKHLISKPGMASYFKSEDKGRRDLKSVENIFKCIIEVDGKFTSSESKQVLLRHKLQRGVELTICKSDMTEMNVDVIVNAANDRLQHIGGLAKAIVDAGGKEIQIESDKIMTSRGGVLLSGEVVLTDAGKLPCKKVIHTVGPRYKSNQQLKMKMFLMKSVTGAYEEAEKYRFTSIAMPAISSGVYGYPLAPCTQAILEATKEYFDDNPGSTLQQVYFLSNDSNVCKAFESAMKVVFQVEQEDDDDDGFIMLHDNEDLAGAAMAMPARPSSGLKISGDVVTTKEGITIRLVKGKIEDSKVDVIVNTTSGNFNLNCGNVSKALLKAAGAQLQQECSTARAAKQNMLTKEFIETGPASLKCKKVFHTSSQAYNGQNSIQDMRELLKNLLLSASTMQMQSIAIPALGTGNLGYPADTVAKIMYEEAIGFSANHPQSNLKKIHFLTYHKDNRTIQAFVSEIKNLKYPENKQGKTLKKPQKAYENVSTPSTSSPYKNFKKLNKLQAEMEIGSVTVTIAQGDITISDADAIVNLTSSAFDLSYGAVSKAILTAGGNAIQSECLQNQKRSPTEEVWTGPGSLNCGGICHLPIPRDDDERLKAMLVRIMRTVNKRQNDTLAFPAIGTGNIGKSSKEAATFILGCICEFSMKDKPTSLENISIIVFDKSMTKEFISAMQDMEGEKYKEKSFLQRGVDFVKSKMWGVEDEDWTDTSPKLTLKILSLDEKEIQGAKGKIQSIITEETTEKILHKDVFSQFTQGHQVKLNKIACKYEVEIDTRRIKSNTVELRGRTVNVMSAQEAIFDMTDTIHKAEKEEKEKKLILKEVKWFYTSEENEVVEFDDDITVLLERAHKKKEKKLKYTASNNHKYEVNLENMEETDLTYSKTCSVIRQEVNDGISVPVSWKKNQSQLLEVIDVVTGSSEYQLVNSQFTAALNGQYQVQSIVKISRIQNVELWKQYAAKKETFAKTMAGQQFEKVLYHGTDEGTIDKINKGGFNRSYAGKNAVMYGQGTYFATSAGYSARDTYSKKNANGEKNIFLCHVLVGKCGQGQQGMLAPPPGFDSVGDNPTNPQIIVIFHDVQAYPSYLITFK
ncbi:protein mono-ADP-ribosyltransferase PARP14-like [Antedon mediterranea]|uniref:protein mono-ADP-ribosyltransferase PARP14-like n=1 Tax=Antedon mediterranea TaxID=105859 RepID=UPI003AF5EC2E